MTVLLTHVKHVHDISVLPVYCIMVQMGISDLCRLAVFIAILSNTEARTPSEWKTRIIYQILTDRFAPEGLLPKTQCNDLRSYCGGKFKGIQENLDYIQNLGANAIWMSPVVSNTPLGYHGYWAKDIYSINPEFGTAQDLLDLIQECHRRDIWVMLDIVANHMGYNGGCFWSHDCSPDQLLNFTGFSPFDQAEHYHDHCEIMNWTNQTEVELCRLAKLPDLNQSNPFVRQELKRWIKYLGDKYNFDGYRIDTAVLVDKPFWTEFQRSAGRFCIGEANNGNNVSYLAAYQGPMDSVLNFPLFHALVLVFNKAQSMSVLTESLKEQRQWFDDVTVLGSFVDNHDFPRFLSQSNSTTLLRNALTYILIGEGIPIIYYGTEQDFAGIYDPLNRESLWPYYNQRANTYKFIARVAKWRQASGVKFGERNQREIFQDENHLVFTRGRNHEILTVVTNAESSINLTFTPPPQYVTPGTKFLNILQTSDTIEVSSIGEINLNIINGEPKIYQRHGYGTNRGKSLDFSLLVLSQSSVMTLFVVMYFML